MCQDTVQYDSIYHNGYNVAEIDANGQPGDPNAGAVWTHWLRYRLVQSISAHAAPTGQCGQASIADFQIYDYALSDAEIAYLATDGTGQLLIPLTTKANLKIPAIRQRKLSTSRIWL